jgi:hypothetical protein
LAEGDKRRGNGEFQELPAMEEWRNGDKREGEGGFQELPTIGGGGQVEGRGRAPGAATMLVRDIRGTGARRTGTARHGE